MKLLSSLRAVNWRSEMAITGRSGAHFLYQLSACLGVAVILEGFIFQEVAKGVLQVAPDLNPAAIHRIENYTTSFLIFAGACVYVAIGLLHLVIALFRSAWRWFSRRGQPADTI